MKSEKLLQYTIIFFTIICIIPFLYISFYIHPTNDDYVYALTHIDMNCWEAMIDSYLNWSGRFFATLISSLNPLSITSQPIVWYKIYSFILILFFCATIFLSAYLLFRKIFSLRHIIATSCFFILLYLTLCPKVSELFYWFSSYTAFTIPNIVALLFLALFRYKHPIVLVLQAILAFLIPSGNEVTAILFVMTMIFLSYTMKEKRFYIMTLISILSIILVILSPGNSIRMDGQLSGHPYIWTLLISTFQTISWAILWLPTLILATFIYIPMIGIHIPSCKIWNIKISHYIIFTIITVFLAHIPPTLGLSSVMIGRTANALYFFYILLYFIGVQIIIEKNKERIADFLSFKYTHIICGSATFCFIFLGSFNLESPICTAYMDIISGKAQAYNQQWNNRNHMAQETNSGIVIFNSFDIVPKTIYINDLEDKANAQFCNAYAEYYQLDCQVQTTARHARFTTNFETLFTIGKAMR